MSWMEIKYKLYTFTVGDRSHPRTEEIHAILEEIYAKLDMFPWDPFTYGPKANELVEQLTDLN